MDPTNPYQPPIHAGPPGGFGGGDQALMAQAQKTANTALIMAIVGLVCCGIILGPLALMKANEASSQMVQAGGIPSGTIQAAKVIAYIDIGLFVLGVVLRLAAMAA